MYKTLLQNTEKGSKNQKGSIFILGQADIYLRLIQLKLDELIDKRLVRTFYDLFVTILSFRNRSMGLLLSELGGYIKGFDHSPAGTKRISNLLRSKKWKADLIDDFLFERSKARIEELQKAGKRALLLWDDSRIEKPESWFAEGLCSVFSSKGKRLTKMKKGFYRPPMSRICVPGFEWTAVMLSALGSTPSVCQMSWWTTRGKFKEVGTNLIYRMLKKISLELGRTALHILDRGYANSQMLEWFFKFQQDFVVRWKKNHLLVHDLKGEKKTHLLARSFRPQYSRLVQDKERKKIKRISIAWASVQHPDHPQQDLTLVIVRDKKNFNSPMYLLSSLPVQNQAHAWEICFSYFQRWDIEQAFRFGKSELAMESPRLWFWENRLKLLSIVALVYDFLLQLIRKWKAAAMIIIERWCHRTGERYRNASIPLYRLRSAISLCLFFCLAQNSG